MRRFHQPGLKAQLVLAVLALGYFLAVAMSVSPALHDLLHHDAADSGHHCMATALSNGLVDSAHAAPPSVTPDFSCPAILLTPAPEPVCAIFPAGFLLEHAPPAA